MSRPREPLGPADAKKLLRAIVAGGEVGFTSHALDEMEHDAITQADVTRVLRGGTVEPAEFENGSWRYRVRAQSLYVIATFRTEVTAVVVTAWRTAP